MPPASVYTPFTPRHFEHEAFNTLPRLDEENSLGLAGAIFKLFLTEEVLEKLTFNTNLYAILSGCFKDGARECKRVKMKELKVWFGIFRLMGVRKEPRVEDYWRPADGVNSYHGFTEHMRLARWQQINRYLHVTLPRVLAPDAPEENEESLAVWTEKVQWLLEHLETTSRNLRTIGSRASLDESMIQQTGRSCHTYHMPGKPISNGHKLFVIAERGYVYALYPDTPVLTARNPLNRVPNLSEEDITKLCRTSEIVLHLALRLA